MLINHNPCESHEFSAWFAEGRRDFLGARLCIHQLHRSPAIASLATLSAAVAFAYGSEPLSMVIAIITIALAAYPVYEFSRYVASSGGYYRLIERGARHAAWDLGRLGLSSLQHDRGNAVHIPGDGLVVQYGLGLMGGIGLPSWSWIPMGLLDAALALVLPYLGG